MVDDVGLVDQDVGTTLVASLLEQVLTGMSMFNGDLVDANVRRLKSGHRLDDGKSIRHDGRVVLDVLVREV